MSQFYLPILSFMDISVVSNILALTNGAAMNTVVRILLNMLYEFMLDMYLRVKFLGNELCICSSLIALLTFLQVVPTNNV